ncbi:hypothetical protein BT67DRAFT_438166 [Trichocladium antarcticum]|uniref:Uncharacterized protein n=1 Tax=Trichocladium antarcticum TaxID=1450529 RepID=A0AAN6UVZ3_9PEZI|nr:hypothetical protein BT67DRAFT_438166 [Trichocladium antarcticum]
MDGSSSPDGPLRISELNFDEIPESYPGLVLRGNAQMRGLTYGRVFADKIKMNITRSMAHKDLPPWQVGAPYSTRPRVARLTR